MRISVLLGVLLGVPAAVGFGTAPGPQIRLVDSTIQMLSPYDVANPAVGNLDPVLLGAVQQAAAAAAADGVAMTITSGWRSVQFQQQLLDEAVLTHGSLGAALAFVQTPEVSRHVLGHAVDIGGPEADQWLIVNGSRFGLCQIYANEPWHFELATDAVGNCPPLRATAAG